MKLFVKCETGLTRDLQILTEDGEDITNLCSRVVITAEPNGAVEAELTILVTGVRILADGSKVFELLDGTKERVA